LRKLLFDELGKDAGGDLRASDHVGLEVLRKKEDISRTARVRGEKGEVAAVGHVLGFHGEGREWWAGLFLPFFSFLFVWNR
jgi:hypothetical protein